MCAKEAGSHLLGQSATFSSVTCWASVPPFPLPPDGPVCHLLLSHLLGQPATFSSATCCASLPSSPLPPAGIVCRLILCHMLGQSATFSFATCLASLPLSSLPSSQPVCHLFLCQLSQSALFFSAICWDSLPPDLLCHLQGKTTTFYIHYTWSSLSPISINWRGESGLCDTPTP